MEENKQQCHCCGNKRRKGMITSSGRYLSRSESCPNTHNSSSPLQPSHPIPFSRSISAPVESVSVSPLLVTKLVGNSSIAGNLAAPTSPPATIIPNGSAVARQKNSTEPPLEAGSFQAPPASLAVLAPQVGRSSKLKEEEGSKGDEEYRKKEIDEERTTVVERKEEEEEEENGIRASGASGGGGGGEQEVIRFSFQCPCGATREFVFRRG